jgi:hypothetical protein
MNVNVKFLIFKFGKLLLTKDPNLNKWKLIEGNLHNKEDLYRAVYAEIMQKSGWETKNIRLFQINANTGIEVVFIVDAIKQTLQADKKIQGLRWFTLNDLPKPEEIILEHSEIIYSFADLVHHGKTLDLEHLPPVFHLKKDRDKETTQCPRLT